MAQPDFPETQRIIYLVSRYIDGSIDFTELQELALWRKQKPGNEALFKELINTDNQERAIQRMQQYDSQASLDKLLQAIHQKTLKGNNIHRWQRILAAASITLVIGAFGAYFFNRQTTKQVANAQTNPQYVPAGTNKATLTLANGQKINLDDSKNGTIARQSGATIQKKAGGLIAYVPSQNTADTATTYNLIETPRGGQYRLELPDGTKVWLNAASSLKYPSQFKGKQRAVTLTGEGYFEVVHNAKQQFTVKTATQVIKDIGTSFNINAYTDEPHSITTLVEGSIQLVAANRKFILKPGQQGITNSGNTKVSIADIETATAWKNGQLAFHHSDIQNVLRQISRWYNIEIKYQGKVPDITISGGVARSADLSAILKMLQLSEVHFVQQGHTLIIKQ